MSASDSDEDKPLATVRAELVAKKATAPPTANGTSRANGAAKAKRKRPATEEADDDDGRSSSSPSSSPSNSSDEEASSDQERPKVRRATRSPAARQAPKRQRKSGNESGGGNRGKQDGTPMWTTLRHSGVLFPPEYTPHGVKMLYDGTPVDLTPEQEEVATMYAIMIETDYMKKDRFNQNFWAGFSKVLGKNHKIKSLDKCDFRPIYNHLIQERDAKKKIAPAEKKRLKEEKDELEKEYKIAYVDGRPEPVGNFRVEPPGLFRGRGEHPRMGMIKRRVYPRDITINIGKGEAIPKHPYEGQDWAEVRHDRTVTWLAFWKDTVSNKDFKYVFLGATSTFKADSDLAKYEKARKLKEIIEDVRKRYEAELADKDKRTRQMAVALYFIDKLALRAGHEKDEDEADTVGCCTLKLENVELLPPKSIKFDFLGKDSIRYENTVEVDPRVYKAVATFQADEIVREGVSRPKVPSDLLFHLMDASDLNKKLKEIMDGLSVKVFRTYNASITLDRLLGEMEQDVAVSGAQLSVDQKKVEYDKANKEVAVLCNHQRAVPKTHAEQVVKLTKKLDDLKNELAGLQAQLKHEKTDGNIRKVELKKLQIAKMELQMQAKEDLKTVALGTSKINYMDPRITVAWCKRNEVPIEKIFNKSLLAKFNWCMDVEPEFKF